MSIFFIKSILSLLILVLSVFLMFTMFEVLGRKERKYDIDNLKRTHKISGYVYIFLFITITYLCLHYIVSAKTELSARASLHSFLAITILVLFGIKLAIIKVYRQFFEHVKNTGLIIAVLTFGLVNSSGGYYLLISKFGTDKSFDKMVQYQKGVAVDKDMNREIKGIIIKTDKENIGRGKNLFDSKCKFCHNAYSTETKVGPGLKDIFKNPELPVSKKPAEPENIIKQLRQPYDRMPSFEYLMDEEIADILAFLNTL